MGKIFIPKQFSFGVVIFISINMAIKFIAYPMIAHLSNGFINGLILMFLLSITIRYSLICLYDLIKIDWLLIENLKARNTHHENRVTKRIKKLRAIGNFALLIGLTSTDPVVTILYFRRGYFDWNGIRGLDLKILFFVSNLICTLITGGIISVLFEFF